MKRFSFMMVMLFIFMFIGCGGGSGSSNTSSSNTISGVVVDDPVEGAEVYIDFGDETTSTKATTKSDGSFEIKLSDEDLAKINPEVPEGADAPIDDLLIVAKKDGKILRNAISRDINNTGTVYITNDTEAYAEFLESIGAFDTSSLLSFNDELQNGRIKDSSKYAKMIKNLREDVKNYFYGGEQLTKKAIFEKALQDLNKSELATIADDKNILLARNIVSGGDIILPDDVNVSSDDIAVTPKGNGRYTLGDGNDIDKTIYLKISKSDETFALVPVNIKSQTITEVAKRSVTPTEGATLGSDDNVKVVIPPFALNETKEITIKKIETEGESADGKKILDLEPHGTQFQVPITIKINYADFGIDDPYAVQWKYGSLDEGYDDADIVSVDTANKVIYLNVDHFSDLVIKKINNQEFLDLGPNFVIGIPARNKTNVYHNTEGIKIVNKIITNRVFKNFSFNSRYTQYNSNYKYYLGGECVQFVKMIFYPFQYNSVGIDIRFAGSSNATRILKRIYELFNGKRTSDKVTEEDLKKYYYYEDKKTKKHLLSSYGRALLNSSETYGDLLQHLGIRTDNNGKYGDIISMNIGLKKGGISSTGHTAVIYEDNKFFDSNFNSNNRNGSKIGFIHNGYSSTATNYVLTINKNGKINVSYKGKGDYIILKSPQYAQEGDLFISNGGQVDANIKYYKTIFNEEKTSLKTSYGTRNIKVREKPYLYYLVSKKGDGVTQVDNSYKYNPDLLPVAPLRVSFTNGIGKIQNTEDALYEIYAEDNTSVLTANNIPGKSIKTYQINYDGLQGGPKYLTREEVCDVISSYKSGDIDWINAVLANGNELVSELGFGGNSTIQREKSVSCDDVIDKLRSKTQVNSGSIKLVGSNKSLSFDGNVLYKFETEDNIATLNMFFNPSPYIKSPKLQKILFSPIVIDDYYVSWGTTNEKNMQPKPIGFWNQYGYDLEYKGEYGTSTTLEAGKIYSSVEAVNGYFMTLGEGKEAQWHFALAGSHTILVNVPTKKKSDIEHATYTLHNDGKTILLQIANDSGVALENDAFNNWYYLKSQDDNTSFELTGNDFLEVKAEGGVVVVDAIRLEGMADRMAEIKGKVNLKDTEDESKLENLLTLYNPANGKKVEMVTEYGQGYVLPVPELLDYTLKLECTYTPRLKIWSGLYNKSLSRDAMSENLETKYKPVTQTITIHPGDSTVNLAEVTLMPYKTKENVKLHLINAVDGSSIIDANVTIRYGIDNDNNESIAYSGITDENGYFEIIDMPYGQYTAVFSKDGFISTSLNMKIDEDSNSNYDLSMSPALAQGEMRIRLSWGENPSDLDSHLVKYVNSNQEYHIYYGDSTGTNGDNLDRDDTDGYGPETVTIKEINASAKYVYYVYKYAGNGEIKNSDASVKVSYGDSEQTFYSPQEDGIYWKVFTIENGIVKPCTSNCMGTTESVMARSLGKTSTNKESELFRNLPIK